MRRHFVQCVPTTGSWFQRLGSWERHRITNHVFKNHCITTKTTTTTTTVRFLTTTTFSSPSPSSSDQNDSTTTSNKSTTTAPSNNNNTLLPDSANVVIVGGGIIGTSVAYHLAKLRVPNVILVERAQLTSGTTWHAAGLMNTFGSSSSTSTFMRQYSKHLYREILPQETNMDTGYMDVGFIELACDAHRLQYYRRIATQNRYDGVHVQEVTPTEVKSQFPLVDASLVLAGFFVNDDGRVNPTDVTMALARGAKLHDPTFRIYQGMTVTGIETTKQPPLCNDNDGTKRSMSCSSSATSTRSVLPRVCGVTLDNGHTIRTNVVVNCTGMWARQLGEACGGVVIPNQAAEHYYLLTEPMSSVDPSWPVIEDSSRYVYVRPEGGGLMLGLFEREGAAWNADNIPDSFAFGEIEPDWDRMAPYLEKAFEIVPDALDAGVKKLFCGPESFTPDNGPIVGEAPFLHGYFVAAGMNSIGILTGGGIGKILAEWIHAGHAPHGVDVTGINIDRFHSYQNTLEYRSQRTGEALGNTYKVHYPDHMLISCRGAKQSVLHDRMRQANAYFRDVSGWESPAWFAPPGAEPHVEYESFGRENWFPYWEAEHLACRTSVALFDMSFMSKFLVQGADAGAFLNRLSTANVDGECGKITYTQWLNEEGYMEADLTVTKLQEDEFLVVATDTMHNHVLSHMLKRLSTDQHAFVTDVTGRYAQINLQGPKSRDLLQSLTSHDLSNFSFRQAAEIDIGFARLLCMRITYVGELGYELFIPVEQALHVYDRIVERGTDHGLKHAGLRALGSLRLEKGYRDFGHDIDNTDTVLECGLGFTCDYNKPAGFIGQEHVEAQKAAAKVRGGLTKRMAHVFIPDNEEEQAMLHHGEVLWRNGQRISDVRSASYGHWLGGPVGLTMLQQPQTTTTTTTNTSSVNGSNTMMTTRIAEPITKDFVSSGEWQVEIADRRYPCRVSLIPFYDPKSTRIKV